AVTITSIRMESSVISKSTVTASISSGWQYGMRSEVFFAAMIAATFAMGLGSPLGALPSRSSWTVAGCILTTASAVAILRVSTLWAMFLIWGVLLIRYPPIVLIMAFSSGRSSVSPWAQGWLAGF